MSEDPKEKYRKGFSDRTNHYTCRYCPDRYVGCHSTCAKYQAEKEAVQKTKEAIYKNRKEFDAHLFYKMESIRKIGKQEGGTK